jgi:hypothetical protein
MNAILRTSGVTLFVATLMVAFAPSASAEQAYKAKLNGKQEVPAVDTKASGTAKFEVKKDMSISGSVKTEGIKGIAAHIHEGAAGKSGGVAIPLTQKGDNQWVVPAGSKLTSAQMDALKAGNLYVNVHSDAHKDGEIRGQIKKQE